MSHEGPTAKNEPADHQGMIHDMRRRLWICLLLTLPILLLSPMIQHWLGVNWRFSGDGYLLAIMGTVVFVYGGMPFFRGAFTDLAQRQPGMMTLVAVAITAAWAYSTAVVFGLAGEALYWELATLVDIMLLGHWLEMKSVMGASNALDELSRLMPEMAHVLQADGSTEDMPLSHLREGDRVLVKPGEQMPADGTVLTGESAVNEALLTGESLPVEKHPGAEVIGGSVNGQGSLEVEVAHTGDSTYLSQVARLVQEAQASKSRSQDLANRAAAWLTLVALGGGLITFIAWYLANSRLDFALERTITVMVIACPHALGLAVPLVVAVSTALGARRGLLIRNRQAFEQARNLRVVVFDKTGTLTEGEFKVRSVTPLADLPEAEVLQLAAAVEAHSEHPIAQGIVRAAREEALEVPPVEDFQALAGRGAQGQVRGTLIAVVSPGYLEENQIEVAAPQQGQAGTVVYVLQEGAVVGTVTLGDSIRPDSAQAVQRLKRAGLQVMMLTGDNERVARSVAEQLGLSEYFAQVLPEQKADKIQEIRGRGLLMAMVGDGVNDAPALASADIGIAIGAGTDVAIAAADIVLVGSNVGAVADLLILSRATWRKMVQNLAWATGYNVIALPLAAGVLYSQGIVLSPAVGAVLMSLSTIIVAINARLLKFAPSHQSAVKPSTRGPE
ncbi:MAG: copper-translocating P-type ATPase [Armatimonadota bacterium]